jgi:hypothetical protein
MLVFITAIKLNETKGGVISSGMVFIPSVVKSVRQFTHKYGRGIRA